MKYKIFLFILGFFFVSEAAAAEKLNLNVFQDPSGSITVLYGGNLVDPYFATKALLLAGEAGLDIVDPAKRWIEWMLKHQRADGLFERYCRATPGAEWVTCAESDADDAVLALWIELLYYMAPDSGLPKAWRESADKAQSRLGGLFNQNDGVYHVSSSKSVGLLMDNVEIYDAMRRISLQQKRMKMDTSSWFMRMEAANLLKNIYKIFGDEKNRRFKVTTQDRNENLFYPDKVAQIFPKLYNLPDIPENLKINTDRWFSENGNAWLNMKDDVYPWGLIAVYAIKSGRPEISACWLAKSESFRYSARWNILEEAAYQYIKEKIKAYKQDFPVACFGVLSR